CKHCGRDLQKSQGIPTRECPFCKTRIPVTAVTCPSCGDDVSSGVILKQAAKPSSALKQPVSPVVGLFVLVVAGVLFYVMLGGSNVSGPANSYLFTGSTSPGGVSLNQFQQLRDGMTYAEAVGILGSPGTEQSR